MSSPEFRKWWVGTDTARHPTNKIRADSAMYWAYEGWVRGVEAEREACADFLEHGFIDDDDHHLLYAGEIRARGDKQ